jgi:hypothetical protein
VTGRSQRVQAEWSTFEAPCTVPTAIRRLDQTAVLERLRRTRQLSRDRLLAVAMAGVRAGAVPSARVEVSGRGHVLVVDAAAFQAGFDAFVGSPDAAAVLHRVRGIRWFIAGATPRLALRRVAQDVATTRVGRATATVVTPWVLRLGERVAKSPEDLFRLVSATPVRPSQHKGEIASLLRLMAERPRASVLEIGTNRGGTIYLLARYAALDSVVVTVDVVAMNRPIVASFARGQQRVVQVQGSSHEDATMRTLRDLLPDGVDVLMIDGDHTYEGASSDFERYASWVRPGGLIVFHDIVPDNATRLGINTGGWVGGVPQLWQELKVRFPHKEFVASWDQDGLGIGVLHMP